MGAERQISKSSAFCFRLMTLPPLCAVFSLLCMNETYSMAVVSPTILNLSLPWQWCTVWDRVLHLPLCMVAFPVSSHVISTSVFMHAPLEYQDRFMHVHTGYRTHIDHIRSLSLTYSFQFDFIDNCVSDFSKIMFYMCILCYLLSINLNDSLLSSLQMDACGRGTNDVWSRIFYVTLFCI